MAAESAPICEWDASPNPLFNLWTIGNSSEVVPGISTPFISSTGQYFEYESARMVVDQLGIGDLIPLVEPPRGNWAAVFGGRWALNLAFLGAVIGTWQLGGPSGIMEQFITSTDGHDISAQASGDPERARTVWRRVRRIRGQLPLAVQRDRARVDALRARERGRDLSAMSLPQLWRLILRLRKVCASLLARHLHVSVAAGDYTDRLNKFLDAALPGHDPALVVALTSALRNVESAAPAKGAWDVARVVARRRPLVEQVLALTPAEIAARLRYPVGPQWKAFAAAFDGFIAQFGFRGMGEVDPAFADWEEEPAFALSSIRVLIDAPAEKNPYSLEERAAAAREAVEARVSAALPRAHHAEYRELLAGAQTFTRLRESSKANWVRGDRTLRRPLLAMGRRLVDGGVLGTEEDIFWLLESDVAAAVRGDLAREQARLAVPRRKAEAARLSDLDLPEVFELPVEPLQRAMPAAAAVLQGMPVSAGRAVGPARVVLTTESAREVELKVGEVLIAPFTDAPWTPLFIAAAAVVVETGGMLSHAATVAREFGIPAVVAVKGATKLIRDGQLVTVDGMTGSVTIG